MGHLSILFKAKYNNHQMPTKKEIAKIKKENLINEQIKLQEEIVDTFDRQDCDERDYNDDGLSRKRKKNAKVEEKGQRSTKIVSTDFLPNSVKQLRACVHCK